MNDFPTTPQRSVTGTGLFSARVRMTLTGALLAFVAIFYLVRVARYCAPYASSSDASGYLNSARLLLQTDGVGPVPVPKIDGLKPPEWDYFYQQPLGFMVNREAGTMVPTYPVGLPLHLALAAQWVGLDYAMVPVGVFLAAAAAGLMITLGRYFGLSWRWALAGAALLWGCPLFIFMGTQPMSDVPAMVWVMALVLCTLRAREHWHWGFAAGLAMAIAVLVRPSNLVALAPVAVILGWRWRAWLALGSGGLPGAVFLVWYNLRLYGTAFTTGYGDVSSLFGFSFVPHNISHFAWWIPVLLFPPLALAALGLPWALRGKPRQQAILISWAAAFIVFYVFYFYSGETWWYLRFILPAFPPIILAGLIVAQRWLDRATAPWKSRLGLAACLIVAFAWQVTIGHQKYAWTIKHGESVYVRTVAWMKAHAPANAIVLQMQASGSFFYYTDFTVVRWDLIDPTQAQRLYAAARASRRPVYATLFDFEKDRAFLQHLPGHWRHLADVRQVSVWQLEDSPAVP